MKEEEGTLANEFDRLENLFASGGKAGPGCDEDADYLAIIQCLQEQGGIAAPKPLPTTFQAEVMRRVRRKSPMRLAGLATLAAALLVFVLLNRPQDAAGPMGPSELSHSGVQGEETLVFDEKMLAQVSLSETKTAMHEYLKSAEKLLLSMRESDLTCTEDQVDLIPEKELAQSLLLKQKVLATDINNPEFFQVRRLFSQLERILVDINNMDMCSDRLEIDMINEHINERRILGRLRVLAREIQLS